MGFPGYAADAPLPNVTQILDGVAPANTAAIRVDILPGSQWRYSGGGYVLSQRVLMDVTGDPLPKLLDETVLAPLGMTLSTYEQPLPAARIPKVAMPHNADGEALRAGPHVYPELAAAGLWTTPTDLARFVLGVDAALAGKSKVISAKTARAMLTPVIGGQGLGLQVAGSTARKFFMHSGANAGYRCLLVGYEDGEGAVIMTNADRGDELMGDVMRTIAHVYRWPDFAPPTRTLTQLASGAIQRFAGVYRLDEGSTFVVRAEGDHLVGTVLGSTPAALSPSSDHEFFARDVDAVVNFTVDADGRVSALRHRLGGWERSGIPVEESRARVIMAYAEQTARRISQQQAAPGSDAAIRKLFAGLASGKPDYEILAPPMAELTRQNLPGLESFIASLGGLKGLTFRKVTETGGDEYDADFESGALRITLALDEAGKIAEAFFIPR
jgi:CubicO group peptidase (beta-lactamase class C family)